MKPMKFSCHFDDEQLKFAASSHKISRIFPASPEKVQELFEEINKNCDFSRFRPFLSARSLFEASFYLIFPIVFVLAIIGFENGYDIFGLAWFFIAFFFAYLLLISLIFYLISSKMSELFNEFSLKIQEILNDFNIKFFVKQGIYASFRFQSSEKLKFSEKNQDIFAKTVTISNKEPGNQQGLGFKFKEKSRTRFTKMLKIRFWVEFLVNRKEIAIKPAIFAENRRNSEENRENDEKIELNAEENAVFQENPDNFKDFDEENNQNLEES